MNKLQASRTYQIPQFNKVVESINFYKNNHIQSERKLMFEAPPEGVFELVFQENDSVWQKNGNEGIWKQRDEAFVGGLHQQSFQIKLAPKTELVSVRFRPGAFKYFYSGSSNDFANEKIPVQDVWQSSGKLLSSKLKSLDTSKEKVNVIASFLENQFNQKKFSKIDEIVKFIVDEKGLVEISKLEAMSFLSSAQFRKRFREEVGLSPKKFIKIIRVNSAINQFLSKSKGHLIDLAYAHEYFDQSHFIKDFKSIVGKTPSQYFSLNS